MAARADDAGATGSSGPGHTSSEPRATRGSRALRAAAAGLFAAAMLVGAGAVERAVASSPPLATPTVGVLRDGSDVPPVASYTLVAKLNPVAHTIDGEGTLRFSNVSSVPLSEMYVHLYLNGFDGPDTVFMRRDGAGFRGTSSLASTGHIDVQRFFVREMGEDVWPARPETDGDPRDRTDIRVPLPRPIAPGETIHVDLRFVSKLPSVYLRTGFAGSFHMAGQWFPKVAKLDHDGRWVHFPFERFSEFYADFGDYDVTVDVPEGFVVGATGAMVEESAKDGRRARRFVEHAIHDFSFVAWDRFREIVEDADGVALRCLFPPGYEADAARELASARAGLAHFGRAYGPYPYHQLTLVHPPEEASEAGGMEYPTLITTGGPFWLAHSGTRAIELLTLHELAHQWFYGLVATNENAWPFLDEGLTTFAAGEAAGALYGEHPLTALLPISVPAGERIYARNVASHAPIAGPASSFPTGSDYARLVYYRTATLLRTLDRVYPGVTTRALAAYARRQRFEHPGPNELIAAFAEAGGARPAEALRAALFDRASIDVTVEPFDRATHEVVVRRDGDLALPVDIDVTDVNGTTRRITWDGVGRSTTVRSELPIASVLADPDGKLLLDEDLLDDGFALDQPLAPRTLFASAFAAGVLASGVLP